MSKDLNALPEKPQNQRKRFLIFGAISLIALVLCTAAVIGVALSLITEGAYVFQEEKNEIVSLTARPADGDDTVAFLDKLIRKATDDREVYLKTETTTYYENEEITGGDGEAAMRYILKNLLDSVKGLYPESYSGSFEDGFTGYPLISFGAGECTNAVCTEGYTDENGEVLDTENYHITLTVPGGTYPHISGSSVYKNFRLSDDAQLIDKVKEKAASFFKILSYDITPGDFTVEAVSDRLSDKLSEVKFNRKYHAVFNVEFVGDFASLGTRTVAFDYYVTDLYSYTWAGVTLSEKEVNLSEGETHELSVNAVMNDYSEYEILFSSSDDSVATVDEMGYITAVRESMQPVTITVEFTYLGNTYETSCLVTVTTPVEKIKISDDELTLKVGASAVLSAELKPDNATVKDIIWISEDESIAAVDDSGSITALKAGNVKIIAVAKDGSLRDSCLVTVTA